MSTIDEVLSLPAGARFFRADLHIHSFGASHDVRDTAMTPTAIVQTAVNDRIDIISITDHNEISNVEVALRSAKGTSVVVIPGVELSTPQGHLLCYLPTLELLRRFHAQIQVVDSGKPTSRCQQAILECLGLLQSLNGFGILAHVDAESGFEIQMPGASPHKADVICHPALLGIELKEAASQVRYAEGDPDVNRAQMGHSRVQKLNLGSKQFLARVLNSDAHALAKLGRNAANLKRVTRYKMDAPSFEGLRVALEDADARVRIEEKIPQTIPRVLGIKFDGGFLTGQAIHFSQNLNCIIGGRGTGKSTAFEAVRCIAGDESGSNVVDSEVWPEELQLFWRDKAGQVHSLLRRRECSVENIDDPDSGPSSFEVDCFGQGDAARLSLEAQMDPLALQRYLDRFVDLEEPRAAEEQARERLLLLQAEINKAEQKIQLIPQYERMRSTARQQLAALQNPGVSELIELQRQLATERELRKQIAEKLKEGVFSTRVRPMTGAPAPPPARTCGRQMEPGAGAVLPMRPQVGAGSSTEVREDAAS